MHAELECQIRGQIELAKSKNVIISFSTGADSLACYLRLKEWGITPAALIYMEYIHDLPMVRNYIDYFEDKENIKVYRIASKLYREDLRNGLFQRPGVGQKMFADSTIRNESKSVLNERIISSFNDPLLVIGLRYTDGIFRYKTLIEKGALRGNEWNPTASFTEADTAAIIANSGIKLPFEYRFMGRSFESPRATIANDMAKFAPKTWGKVKEVFPMVSLLEAQGKLIKRPHDMHRRIKSYGHLAMETE